MKSVLLSIQPEWCELIASGKKTIEVRKTRPKIETPFKCYIYETKGNKSKLSSIFESEVSGGKVIGEFICDKIDKIDVVDYELITYIQVNQKADMFIVQETCLEINELQNYLGNKTGYGWHISDLVIYDKPKELSEFSSGSSRLELSNTEDGLPWEWSGMKRPPQSWCYVESKKG